MQESKPRVITKVFWLSVERVCLNLDGIFTLPLESKEYVYSPMNVLFVSVMIFWEFYPQLPTMLANRAQNVNI